MKYIKKIFVVYNSFEKFINIITKINKEDIMILNNCSSDKRYYNNFNYNIIHLSKYLINEDILKYLIDNNITYDEIIYLTEEPKEIFSLNNIYNFDNKKFNFDSIVKKIYKIKYNYDNDLSELHQLINEKYISKENVEYFNQLALIGINDRKGIFIKNFYEYIDSNSDFIELYKNFIIEYIKPLYPNEDYILYQKTPNLRIGFPNLTAIGKRDSDPNTEVVGLHNDGEFGHSFEEINYIIPITEMYDTNSIYFERTVNSNETNYDNYYNLKLKTNEFFTGYFNKLKHYNKINKTGKTRVSLDFRIIPYSKYIENENDKSSVTSNKKLSLGEYFELI